MTTITRRSFAAAGAAVVAMPALALAQSTDADVIVVGAGAAGIAAARKLNAAGRRCVVLEAAHRVGGRAHTDATWGIPFDRGASALYGADAHPLARLASSAGIEIVRASPATQLRIGRRSAREGEIETQLAALARAKRAIIEGGRSERDVAAAQLLPKDMGEWRASGEFLLGAFAHGRELAEISAKDFARAGERSDIANARGGAGALLAKLAQGVTVRLSHPVTRISTWRNAYVESTRGGLQARAVIVTASTNVLAAGKIKFEPALPPALGEAFAKLSLGALERIALDLPGNPLGLARDERVFEQAKDQRTAALLANVGGTALSVLDIGGKFARDIAVQGPRAMTAFATEWLAGLFGADAVKAIARTQATQWGGEPWIMGAASVAPSGASGLRSNFAEPVRDRIFFAGEAASETQWGTLGGAWESGERAADAVLRRIGGAGRRR